MTSRDFAFWLQGFFEVSEADSMTPAQVAVVKRHLALVFLHEIDPAMGDPAHQAALNQEHTPPTTGAQPNPFPTSSGTPGGVMMRC